MKLYDCQMAPNPRRVRVFLAEKGVDIPKTEVSIIEGRESQAGISGGESTRAAAHA